ncbi:MAG: carboxypeptidase-like regulatory domain-containing protein [Gammaproteobacteria bacterium]|nr:carboxypeptidase-like regulatory domain-containing protein [Gammaproteobacteria bacterium]
MDLRIVIDIVGRVQGNIDGLMEDESISISAGGAGGRFYENGPYEFVGVESGEQDIRVLTSFGREILDSIVMGDSQESRFDVTLPIAKTLSGRVLAGKQGIAELEIIARPKDSQLPSGRTATIADGSYHFKALAPGLYTVEIPARSFSESIEIQDDSVHDFHVGSFTLSATVYGRRSVRGATVVLSGGPKDRKLEHGLRQITDANGEYRFLGLPNGRYTIKVTHADYEETSENVNVNQESEKLDVYLEESRDPE